MTALREPLTRAARPLASGVSLFTIIPVRRGAGPPRPGDAVRALLWLPAVGAALGAAAAVPAGAIRQWGPHAGLLGAVLAVAALALLTGGLHLDGLADTTDGLGSRAAADRALDIMRKSDIGPFGVVALVLVLAADIAALASLPGGAWTPVAVLAVAAATGRVAAVHAAVRGIPAARKGGFGALVADGVPAAAAAAWTVGVLGFGAAMAAIAAVPLAWVLVPQAVGLAVAWLLRRRVGRRLGGMTGDVFGALIESATAVTLIGIALR